MKRRKEYTWIIATIISITLLAISYKDNFSLSSDIISPEALATSESGEYTCSYGHGFCIINGVAQIGVTYKE